MDDSLEATFYRSALLSPRSPRRRARRRIAASMLLVAASALATSMSAHRLDEYLQATLISIDPDRVSVDLTMTPGVAIAPRVVADIDADGSGGIDAAEARAHADRVRGALTLDLDGARLNLDPVDRNYAPIEAMHRGQGAIRLRFSAAVPALAAGTHRLRYRNDHRTDRDVYLANALVPADARVVIGAQVRDTAQRELVIEYRLDFDSSSRSTWVLAGLVAALVLLAAFGAKISRLLPGMRFDR